MKKKVFSLMMTLLLAVTGLVRAGEITVHDGTATNSYIPVWGLWTDNSLQHEFVYPADELFAMNGGEITALKFFSTSSYANVTWNGSFQVFLKEVGATTLTSFLGTSDATLVYEGSLGVTSQEMEITLDTPYAYNGGNLWVGVYYTATTGYSSCYWQGETVSGASIYGRSGNSYTVNSANFLPKTTITYNGGGAPAVDKLHVKYMDGDVEVIDVLNVGVRPAGAWMEPFNFTMYTDGPTYVINVLDFTPSDGMFTVDGEELPFQVANNNDVALNITTNGTEAGVIERQFVAITEGDRAAHIWPVTVELYAPEVPDVWELACEEATTFPFVEVPASAHHVALHNDYTLPFPEIEEGLDAVYKLVFTEDQVLNASVTFGENGKVALYREGFEGEGGPMATNNYTGIGLGGGGAVGAPFEAQIGEGTSTFGYFPFYTLYNYSIAENLFLASELEAAGVTTAPMTSLSWYATNTTGYNQQGISIWMANVADEALTTTSHVVTGMTLVYTGAMTPLVGWNEFVFNEGSFAWDGHSNILIYCQRNNGTWNSTVYWQATPSMPFNASSYRYQDSGAYDPTVANTMYTSTTRPNIVMKADGRARASYAFDFETDLQGWTNIDNDGDGYGWVVATDLYTGTEGYGANETDNFAMGFSYASGSAFDCDDYLVSPQAYAVGNGASLNFYHDQQSDSWPDYMEVCVSTAATPSASSFAAIWNNGGERRGNGGEARNGFNRLGNWSNVTLDLSAYAGQNVWIAFHHLAYDQYAVLVDEVTVNTGSTTPNPPTPPTPTPSDAMSYGPVIENAAVEPGTYYLVASSTTPDFEVTINAEDMPCPPVEDFAFNPMPADDADEIEPASVTLTWSIPDYATGWRLVFGSTYYPDPNHPQTIMYPEDGSFATGLANSYTVRNLWNNTNYFWHVEFNNDGCPEGVSSPIWGFTTHLNVPQNLRAADETVFNDENIVLSWNAVVDRTYRMYNVYRDGELIGHTQVNNIGNTTYTDGPLAYNMDGYTYYVTAVYDEGESAPSNTVNVKVSGYGDVNGHVYEQDGTTGIAGATVTMTGLDEFGVSHTYNFQTNGQGYYSGHIYAGTYNGQAACNGYQTITEPVQGNPIGITYNVTTSPIDYILDENFDPVCTVIAEYYPDSLDPESPYVKVYWGCGLPGEEIIEPFETGDFSLFDWQVDPTYPWTITTTNPYEGTYCMKSGGAGVANVVSNMTVTVNIPADGEMSFFGKISCESSWDYGYFFIDGTQMGSYTGNGSWGEKRFNVTAGDHTFQWRYTKDGSVNSYDDCFYVDYITFYKRPEPAGPGWHTYLESDFDNAYRSNVGQCEWGYEYPTSILAQYAGYNLTKVAVFSDDMYNAVGGNFTCNVYKGGSTPAAGTLVSTITVDVPVGLGAWCEYDLTNAVNVTGTEPIYVLWTANNTGSSLGYPAGCASHASQYGDWWNPGDGSGWTHMGSCTWTMKNYFTNRGRTVVLGTAEMANAPMTVGQGARMDSHLRTFAKGETMKEAECINPNAVAVPMTSIDETRALSHYRVYRTSCYNDGPYTEENTVLLATVWVPDTIYIDVDWPDVAPGVYKWGVGTVYEGNRGEMVESPISWSEPMSINRATLTYDFDNSTTQGWTTIDANNDGYDWVLGSQIGGVYLVSGASLEGSGHNSSTDMMCSGSYSNATSSAITPDNYLVSPQVALGGSISFWACGQDASYVAEHFGVAVSTTSNTSASAFTTIQEWTMTAKSGGNVMSTGRDGNNRVQGSWYQYTVDLSAYSGMGYVAIRHFNCNDQFILNVDDITIVEGAGGPTPPTPPTPGNTGLQLPRESEIVWSNCLEKGMWLNENAVDITVLLNSADSPEGVTVSFENQNAAEQELYPMADVVLDETGYYAWDAFRKGDYIVTVTKDGYEPIEESVSIWEPTSLRYVMIEIIYGVDNLYVSRTGWAMWDAQGLPNNPGGGGGGGQGGNGDTFECGFENGLEGWTTIDNDGNGLNWVNSVNSTSASGYDYTGLAHGGNYFVYSQSYIDYQGAYEADNYLVTPQKYSIVNGSTLTFWADNANDSYPDHFAIAISTADTPNASSFTDVWSHQGAKGEGKVATRHDGDRYQNWRSHSVDLSAYAGQNVWIAFHHQDYDEYEIWIDDVALTTGAKDGDRHLEGFKVMCTSIDGEPIFNTNTVHPFCQVATDELVEGEHYICKVAAIYSTGMSDWVEAEWEYESCEHYAGTVNGVTVDDNNVVSWDYPGGTGPTPPPGNGSTFSVNFDDSQIPAGWITIDGGSPSGYGWQIGSTKLGSTGNGHNGSTDLILSQSYDNNYGVVYPDNWLISPAVTLANGSTFSLWACGQDSNYAGEHFGVFVSTTGTNPSDFQLVQEWTLTAKGDRYDGPRGNRTQGNWYQKTVDLSNFAGEGRYIAVRHFNCSDMFYLDVDDLELTNGGKGNRAPWDLMMTFEAPEGGHYGVAYDGNNFYTSNWGYSSAAHNFYKYDLQGNMLEGFEISGCGTLRGITYDGTHFYGVANSSTVYCVDLANHSVVSTFTSAYGAQRGITYDPQRNGFWVIGNWSGNLTLIDRTGAIQFTGPTPTSASDLAYYKDENDVEHVFCFNNGDNGVYDYNITTNTLGGSVFNFSSTPGYNSGSSGGCTVGSFNDKIAFIGDLQQSPNLIAIYELRDDNTTPTPPPTPSGDILGAMIFVDGEWEAFVPAPTNTYAYEGEGNEVCVRIVYNGTAELPSNNYYYAMSCEECEEINPVGPGTCEMPYAIHSEQVGERQIKVWWGEEPAAPISEWLYYDDGVYTSSIGTGSAATVYWACMFPAASVAPYAGTSLTKVAVFEASSQNTQPITAYVYLGGTTAPQTLVSTQTFNPVGGEEFHEVVLNTPVAIDGTQNVWIVFSETDSYPANGCANTGDANGRWISLDGVSYEDVTSYGLNYTWMIRGYVTNEGKGGMVENIALEPVQPATVETSGLTLGHTEEVSIPADLSFMNRANIVKYNVYRSTEANGEYTMIGEVAETGATYYEYIDMPVDAGTYYYQVRALYDDGCLSEPAQAADDPNHNYVSGTTIGDGIGENDGNVALYPNPTSGNVTIEAQGMSRITVVSVLGQVVYDTEVNADNFTLNMAQFNAGLYMVRVYTENGVTVKRVTVMQ